MGTVATNQQPGRKLIMKIQRRVTMELQLTEKEYSYLLEALIWHNKENLVEYPADMREQFMSLLRELKAGIYKG